jgi:prenyltransferase beta subunit
MCAVHAAAAVAAVLTDIAGLQQPDGAFAGDKWGEIDTR